jgi:poly-gamma-glutamate capsule biosynthesis protein CapA/YwtB (metallophosphatase superfamily)
MRPLRLFLCGDVMTGRGIDQLLPHPCDPALHENYVQSALGYVRLAEQANGPIPRPVDPSYIWGAALEEWGRARPDVSIVNLETSITRSEDYADKGINYRMSPENADCLGAAGIDCCVLANNHVLDWGRDGLRDTLDALQRLKIRTAGAGRNLGEASAPAVLPVAGKGRVLVFSFALASSGVPRSWAAESDGAGVSFLSDLSEANAARVCDQIAQLRQAGDVVAVSLHWGPNWGYDISREQRRFAHALIDRAGVSVVHGHSSHHAKGIEVYRNRLVLYGCGDFLNDYEGIQGYEDYRDDLAVMYFADIAPASGDLAAAEIVPLRIRQFRLNRADGLDVDWLRQRLGRESRRFATSIAAPTAGRLALSWAGKDAPDQPAG